jgi:hypothetical protein
MAHAVNLMAYGPPVQQPKYPVPPIPVVFIVQRDQQTLWNAYAEQVEQELGILRVVLPVSVKNWAPAIAQSLLGVHRREPKPACGAAPANS